MQDAVTGEVKALFVCYLDAAGHSASDISILSPLGVSVFGCREGEQVVTEGAKGKRRCVLLEVLSWRTGRKRQTGATLVERRGHSVSRCDKIPPSIVFQR